MKYNHPCIMTKSESNLQDIIIDMAQRDVPEIKVIKLKSQFNTKNRKSLL